MSNDTKNIPNPGGSPNHSISTEVINLLGRLHTIEHNTAFMKLKSLNRDSVIEVLSSILKNPDSEKRALAVEALMNIDTRQTLDLVLSLLDDPDSEVRWTICYWLCDDGDFRAIEPLIKILKEDNNVNVRTQAAIALGASGDSRARDVLIWAKEHDFGIDFHGHTVSHAATIALQNLDERL